MRVLQIKTGLALIALFALLCCGGGGKSKQEEEEKANLVEQVATERVYIRKAAGSAAAANDLKSLATAMAIMRRLPCDSIRGWYYQGAIHSVPHMLRTNPWCPSYRSAMRDLKKGWMKCTHEEGSELHFLIWHRLYVWHLERLVRKLSGNPDFALPYWDYTDRRYRIMPAAVRDTRSSLFEKARVKHLNDGRPIIPDVLQSMEQDMISISRQDEYTFFNNLLDNGPHGTMHWYIGGGLTAENMFNDIMQTNNQFGYMANVESAAFDPVFWLHHANIDYLWQKWEKGPDGKPLESKKPILRELQNAPWEYLFFDENGKEVSYTVEQAWNKIYNLDYTYDVFQQAEVLAVRADTVEIAHHLRIDEMTPQQESALLSVNVNAKINDDKKVITVKIPSSNKMNKFSTESIRPENDGKIVLEVRVAFKEQPKNIYKLYIGTKEPDDKNLAGTLSFFGAMHMKEPASEYYKVFRFDVTDSYRQDNGNFNMVVVKSTGDAKNEISLKDITFKVREVQK